MTRHIEDSIHGTELGQSSALEVLTLAEAAQLLRCSKAHLCNVLNGKISGLPELPHISLGRRTLIRKIALERWLEGLEASANPR
jgi:excisionase family DNA binding protein